MSQSSYYNDLLHLRQADRDQVERIIVGRLVADEHLEDVLAGSAFLARRRAELIGSDETDDNFLYILSLFTWWPFKPDLPRLAEASLVEFRLFLFRGASNGRFERLQSVPDQILALSSLELVIRQLGDPQEYLTALGIEASSKSPSGISAESPFKSDSTASNMCGFTLMTNQVGAAIATVMGTKPNVKVTYLPSIIRVDAVGRMEVVYDEVAEALGEEPGAFDEAKFLENMSTHYGRVIYADDRTVFFANPEDAAAYLGFDLGAR